ncbi:hypothetical protein [Geomonas ferrireducens]|uniref:hypothetical protein n=1 Tax=Geomonas ferrireducens TaxID=2570227 RepID=UPI001FECB012|nr:hypothetical protein [Geomonas ferrireducens]
MMKDQLLFLPSTAAILSVLKPFLIPVGGGIPAGVLLAKSSGLAWQITALIYLVSDIILAVVFEPILRVLALICSRIPFLRRFAAAMKAANARHAAQYQGTAAGPIGLILIAFGVDPMTGRASALAAGHGFIAGWAFAIAGDMLYFGVIAYSTLSLNRYIKDPETTMLVILALMFLLPVVIRRIRSRRPASVAREDLA